MPFYHNQPFSYRYQYAPPRWTHNRTAINDMEYILQDECSDECQCGCQDLTEWVKMGNDALIVTAVDPKTYKGKGKIKQPKSMALFRPYKTWKTHPEYLMMGPYGNPPRRNGMIISTRQAKGGKKPQYSIISFRERYKFV